MNKEDLRLECLKLASTTLGLKYSETVEAAKAYVSFIEASDNKTAVARRKRKVLTRLRTPESNI
jgi:hypothetical protein